ncbi:S8 family serine peptidase [Cellulomonas fimi]|uniref:S8 family serine peptidase n=1 Tax=Cellulomonas fimi TaxID=1708 RepID=UPI00234D3A19|nr:S8 family serine peptidase [Cellulomonas fimi]MDC7123600.1 S8 family serine peptidase [Cellulomonas fimi]
MRRLSRLTSVGVGVLVVACTAAATTPASARVGSADAASAVVASPTGAFGAPGAARTATVLPGAAPVTAPQAPEGEAVDPAGLSAAPWGPHADDVPTAPEPADDHVLVRFEAGTSAGDQRRALDAAGTSTAGTIGGTGFVEVPVGDASAGELVETLAADPRVADVQLDHVRRASWWPDDEWLPWAEPYVQLARLPRAWDVARGDGVVVAVLDSGVDATHEDLQGSVLPGVDLVDDDDDPSDPAGHGTLVAGIVAARADNGVGLAGAAPDATILPVRVLDADGFGTDSVVAEGIAWAVAHGADVVNLSLGGPETSPVLASAINAAVDAGVVVVAASGNEGTEVAQYPAAYAPTIDGLLSVGAVDRWGALAGWSSWGDTVTVTAPGEMVAGPGTGGDYVYGSGTSFAAPMVSGVAALLAAHTPTLTPAQVEQRLVTTARDAGQRGRDAYYGAGIVDAAAAVTAGDTARAATAAPLDRAPGDPQNDAPGTPTVAAGTGVTGTLAPEGDVDWYQVRVPAAGWWRFTATPLSPGWRGVGPTLDLALEIQDVRGGVLGRADARGVDQVEDGLVVGVAEAGPVLVGVRNANGSAPAQQAYSVAASVVTDRPFFDATSTPPADESRWWNVSLAVGELTGDAHTDVVSAEMGGDLYVYPGRGDGTLATPIDVQLGTDQAWGQALATAELDGDPELEIVVGTNYGVRVLDRNGAAFTMRPATQLVVRPSWPATATSLATVDWDRDGDVDVVAIGEATHVLLNDGDGNLTDAGHVAQIGGDVSLGDVTGDGRPDVVTARWMAAQQPDGSLGAVTPLPALEGSVAFAAVGDVTGDGRADVVRTNGWGWLYVDAQLPSGGLAPTVTSKGGLSNGDLALGDVDQDGRTDILMNATSSGFATLVRQQPDGTLGAPTFATTEQVLTSEPGSIAFAQLDGDGRLDAVIARRGVTALRQASPDVPATERAWVRSLSPAPHSAGADVRPTVRVQLWRDVPTSTLTTQRVRLLDAVTGQVVPSKASWDATTRTVALVPTVDLVRGRHYVAHVAGIADASGAVLPAPVRVPFTVGAGGERYTPVPPERVLDTRTGLGGTRQPTGARLVLDLSEHLPTSATAVVLNLTATRSTGPGNVRAFPATATTAPQVSNVNYVPGSDKPNLVTVALGPDRRVALQTDASPADLIADLAGYYSTGGAGAYNPLPPRRVLDTRNAVGGFQGPLTAGRWVDLKITGNGVPTDALAVVLNVTGTQASAPTHVRVGRIRCGCRPGGWG